MRHFHFKNLGEIEQCANSVGATSVGFEHDPERVRTLLARKVRVGGFTLGNSIAIHPMEGCDGTLDGRPDDLTWRRYRRFASGGAKLIWFGAAAVRGDARANVRQLWLHPATMPEFARLLETVRKEHTQCFGTADDLLDVLQLNHSGRYSVPSPIIACHHPAIDRKTGTPRDYPVISDDELERLEDDYLEAARLAVDAGFRGVDIKATHGYLLSELLSAKRREGRYGGSLENRARFFRNVFGKIRAAVGSRLKLCVRLGCYDGVPHVKDPESDLGVPVEYACPYDGFGVDPGNPLREDLSEVKQVVAWFKEWGVDLLNVSLGSPYMNLHIGRPYEQPDEGNYEQPEHPLLGVDRHFRIAGELQRAFPDLPMVGTGYSWLQRYMINAAAWNIDKGNIRIFGAGRAALPYPDFALDALEKGELDESRVCKTLTYCTYLMRQKRHPLGQFPTGCVPFDKTIYGPILKQAREAERAGKRTPAK
jgi:2,4-dienoyl-CoA reductase-like NADH-dependent reductase (Old Yellow Enzyme family)